MNKEKQEIESEQLIDELSKMPPMVIATAYLHAINYTLYGEDVTEKWVTATQNASALEKAYRKGYHDALQRQAESEPKTGHWIREESLDGSIRYMCDNCKEYECVDYYNFCPNCGADMRGEDNDNK